MDVEKMNRKELTDKELVKVSGGNGGGMDTGKVPPLEGLSSNMVAELEKYGLANLGGAVATPGGGASQLVNEGRAGIDPRSEPVANPFSLLSNVDTINRPPTPPSPVAESVKKAVDAALQTW